MKIDWQHFLIIGWTLHFLTQPQAFAVPAEGHKIMIAAPSPYAVEVGQSIARSGGNLIDVAVAVGLTLSVTSPYFAALGGGGFALLKMNNEVEVLDFRETAPAQTSLDFYLDKNAKASTHGGTAIGIPGFPAGLWALHQKYGKLPWRQLFSHPIQLANQGFSVSGEWVRNTHRHQEHFNSSGQKIFFKKDGQSLKPGELLRQPGLGKALREFRNRKHKGFYEGAVARDIVASVQESGGVITLEDLKNYQVRWLKPLKTTYLDYDIYLMPPPSSGGVVIHTALQLAEQVKLSNQAPLSLNELHLWAEILNRSFRGRALLGDPDFHTNPLSALLSSHYIKELVQSISLQKARQMKPLPEGFGQESVETTHFSIMNADGQAIALTVTLNGNYGSGVVSNRYGIALNNEMDDFTTRPNQPNMFGLIQGQGNLVEPGKRPLSSMSPTLVVKDDKVVMSLGSPGGPRIISSVAQVLYRVLHQELDMDMAIQAPRVHHQFLPNILYVDRQRFSPETLDGLRARGHQVEESWMGKVYGVRLNSEGLLEGAFDARGEGAAGGI